jgi:hypothetical protein
MLRVALLALALLVLLPVASQAGGRGFVRGGVSMSHSAGFKSGHGHFGGAKARPSFAARPFHHHPARSVFPRPVDPWKFWGAKHGHRPFFKSPFVTSGVVFGGGTTVVYAPPVVYEPSETVVYSQPAAVYAPPAPMSTVVEYPTGWYVLRGDGVTTAYQWVWIPKPPPAPPPPPEAAPEPDRSRGPERQERAIGKIYRWTDDEGVTTFTDRLENVPARYRSRAEPKA